MKKLSIENFSCIDKADVSLSRLTVLIGPQASGKSVVSKLIYFFSQIVFTDQVEFVLRDKNIEVFKDHIRARFIEWFPESAWGNKQFKIDFTFGIYSLRLVRIKYKDTLSANIRLSLSPDFESLYTGLSKIKSVSYSRISQRDDEYEIIWRYEEQARRFLKKEIGSDFVLSQLFIPAGRSFFTSIGKIVTAFDQGGLLDPVTTAFGRRLAGYRERLARHPISRQNAYFSNALIELLGGRIKFQGGKEFVEAPDGRTIPFAALSSGQQELLPLLITIAFISNLAGPGVRKNLGTRQIYIEEPEAHLFPTAQSQLITILASLLETTQSNNLVITTHSPYVLAKINNLIKAGSLAKKLPKKVEALSQIIPQSAWLAKGSVNAYAFINGTLIPITAKDGLIAADYLDDVSGEISREFSSMLELEISK